MPKRKRTEPDVGETFTKWRTELFRALKLAKGFERQRQSKKIRTQPDKAERVKKEVVVLKSLDLQKTADTTLKKSLLRIKAAAESPRLPAEIKAEMAKPEISEEQRFLLHNVTSSLSNQKPVREVIDKALVAICRELDVSPPGKSQGKRQQPVATAENDPPHEQDPMVITSGEEESDDGLTDVELDREEDEVDDMQGDVGGGDGSRSALPPRKKTATAKGLRSGKVTNSTFLPSLMSGYVSGSDEEASDIEDEIGLNSRQNRRGQRARQAIWEKRYKDKAKHLQQGPNKGAVWDPKRGAVDKDRTKPWKKAGVHAPLARKHGARGRDGSDGVESQRSSQPQPAHKNPEIAGPLHPSWEAAKKAKEKTQTAPFQGKKITFDC